MADVRQFVDEVRDRAQILEVIGEAVALSAGPQFEGLCPFHAEKTPSFRVFPEEIGDRGPHYHCFGCGAHGTVFDWVMAQQKTDFWGAVLLLADRYRIPVPEFRPKDTEKAAKESEIHGFLERYVQASHKKLLESPEALKYLADRGITKESIEEYRIGLGAPIKKGPARQTATAAGLVTVKNDREYELVKGRLLFPIVHRGAVWNINGRTLKSEEPKYMSLANPSGLTPKIPMGLGRLRGRQVVIVEGPIDRILLEQAGIPACATIGTKPGADWLRYCGKQTRFVLAYDSDENQSGQNANEAVGRALFDAGHTVEVLELPVGTDPADYMQKNGAEAFESLMSQAVPWISYWIRRQPAGKRDTEKVLREAYGLLARIDRGVRGRFIGELAKKYSITKSDVQDGLKDYLQTADGRPQTAGEGQQTSDCRPQGAGGNDYQYPDDDDTRPIVYADNEELPAVTEQCWEALRGANDPPQYFRQGGVPVRLKPDDNGDTQAQRWNVDIARFELTQQISFRRTIHTKKGDSFEVVASPSDKQIKNVLSVRDVPLPVLSRITEVPVFAPDGTLQTEPGYHAASRTYYVPAPGLDLHDVPEVPTDGDMAAAKDIFDDIVCDFPFIGEADKAHAFALWLLPFVRDMIPGPTPMHLIEAPSPGSGKGLLMDALVVPSVGPHVGTVTQASDEDEWRKRLTAVILKGQTVVMLDNITRMLDSGTLASALTQQVWEDRILGRSESIDVPIRCIWVCTANNPAMSTEIARRCVRIRIDPKRDRPWEREQFRHPHLRDYVFEQRSSLIWAALVIIRGWVSRGMQAYSGKRLGSYEQWSRVLGGIAECAGIEGFLENLLELYEQADIEGQMWRSFVLMWWDRFKDEAVGVSELFEVAKDSDLFNFGKVSEHSMKISFGRKLGSQRDRVIGEFRVSQAGHKARAILWQLTHVGDGPAPEQQKLQDNGGEAPEMALMMDDDPFGEDEDG